MKDRVIRLTARIDALTLRERVLLFAAVAAGIVFLAYFLGLKPMFAQQEALRRQIVQQQNQIEGIGTEVRVTVEASQVDPDAPVRAQLATARARTDELAGSLRTMQNGLVPPERMAPLVDAILRANGRLQLVSLRTLAAEPIAGAGTGAEAGTAGTNAAAPLLYRHGVEVTVRGNYLDMIGTMAALESMPTRLFWGQAQLEAETWPASRLTLNLYTLSLDPKWMRL